MLSLLKCVASKVALGGWVGWVGKREKGGIDRAVARRRVVQEGMVVVQERDALKLRGASTIQQTVIACHVRLFMGHSRF